MADGPKIVPDSAPAQPVDVRVNPDPPPRKPVDVSILPDQGPRAPVDVSTVADPPPARPFDVTTSLDSRPGAPIDVPLVLDPAPGAPHDVSTVLDAPPAAPVNVRLTPDAPPRAPVAVGVTRSSPPAAPFDVPIFPDPPPELVKGGVRGSTTIENIIKAVKNFDGPLGSFLAGLDAINPISLNVQGAGALDPTALARWLKDYTSHVGGVGIARFISEQESLYAMNPVTARIFDPTYFLKMLIPGSTGIVRTTIDTEAGLTADKIALARDEILQLEVEADIRVGPTDRDVALANDTDVISKASASPIGLSDNVNVYGPGNRLPDGQDFSVDEMVDAAIDRKTHPFLKSVDPGIADPIRRFDASAYFHERDKFGGMLAKPETINRSVNARTNINADQAALARSAFIDGIVRAAVGPNEDADGCVYSQTQNPGDLVDDDDARIPLCFTDLRKDPMRNAYRSIFFRPLDLNFTKSVNPEWSEGGAFGRTDPIVTYQKTSRSYSVSFTVMAFAPEDLELIWKKMIWLDSLCYPSFGPDSLFQSGPVCRIRVGDAIATESGGMSGIIKGLSFDFTDALWELKKGFKVPRSYKASIEFLALHEGPVGLFNGTFGVFQLPPNTAKKDDNAVDANSGGSVPPQQSTQETPRTALVLPGRFAKFGEPKR
jgi:hypothetical protein